LLRSIVLAGAVLKLGILFIWNYRSLLFVGVVLILFSGYYMLVSVDGKVVVAYSSVSHMTLCIIAALVIRFYIGYMHIVISPLIFLLIYISYQISGSRYYKSLGLITMVLMVINIGFPYLRAFNAELYLISYHRFVIVVLLMIYLMMRLVLMSLINVEGSIIYYIPLFVLYLIIL